MELSKRCEYGLRALICLGVSESLGLEVLPVRLLAQHERISEPFLEQILGQLREAGYIRSKRGKHGGYQLARPMDRIIFGDVVRLLDGPLAPIRCVSVNCYERCSCPDEEHCGLRMLMLDVRQAVGDVLDRHTLKDVVTITLRSLERDGVEAPFRAELETPRKRRRT
jgi:Rrf2 family protein